MMKYILGALGFIVMIGCAAQSEGIIEVYAVAETDPVGSRDDAADDPAIWINNENPAQSKIIGTDKQAGLYVYDLSGQQTQFIEAGALNNVDLRQGRNLDDWSGDLVAASNRTDDTISLFEIANGELSPIGAISSVEAEPYGLCMGALDDDTYVFVAHKTGSLFAYRLTSQNSGVMTAQLKLATQLEGCIFDDITQTLFIGEELRGVWKADFNGQSFQNPELIAEINAANGMKADVEGLAIYNDGTDSNYLVISSQGNNSFAIFENTAGYPFVGRFAITTQADIDGAEDTDGIEITATPLGAEFPMGMLVVQDGHNAPRGTAQNFKIIDWQEIHKEFQLGKD